MARRLTYEMAVLMGADYGYRPNQSLEESLRQLRAYFQLNRFDDATLVGMAQMVDPTYTFTAQDRAERATRRERSERARTNFYEFLHRKIEVTMGVVIPRGLDMLLDFSGTDEAKKHNERVQKAFAINRDNKDEYKSEDMEERTAIMKEFLDKMDSMDFGDVYNMSDEQLAQQFPKMFALYSLCTEGGDGVLSMNWNPEKETDNNHFKLDEKYTAKLMRYRDEFQGAMSMLKLRFDHMMDPNYEVMHVERIVPPDVGHMPSVVFNDLSNPIALRMQGDNDNNIQADILLAWYSLHISRVVDHLTLNWSDQIDHMARAKGLDPKNVDLVKWDGTKIEPAEMSYRSILRMQDKETGKSFLLQVDGLNLVEVNPHKAMDTAMRGGDSVVKALEDADPWYIRTFTGSKEFAAMKRQMKAVDEAVKKLERPVSEKQFKEMSDMLKDLGDKTKAYLDKKGIMNMRTKDSERARILAAVDGVQQYVEWTAMLLDANRKADLEIQAKREANNDEMGKNLDTEINFGKARDITRGVRTQEEQESEKVKTERGMKLFTYYMVRGNDDLAKLGRIIYSNLDRKTTDEEVKLPREPVTVIARMVAYDIVMRERADNKSKGIEGPGAVEMKFQENPERFVDGLAKSKTLKDIVAGMKDADFRRFVDATIGRKGSQRLTGQILAEQKLNFQAEGQPKPEQIIQNQSQIPAVPEPPKSVPAVGGNGGIS